MVERYVIPFSMVSNRAMHLQPSSIYETYTDYENDGSMSFYLNVDGNTYDVTYRDFYFV